MKKRNLSLILFLILIMIKNVFGQYDVVKVSTEKKEYKFAAGESFNINLQAKIDEGWHINSHKPNDEFLIPSEVVVEGKGIKSYSVKYPNAKNIKLAISESLVSVYEKTENFVITITTDKNLSVGKKSFVIKLNYQACNNESCLPPNTASTNLEVEITASKQPTEEKNEIKSDTNNIDISSNEPSQTIPDEKNIKSNTKNENDSISSKLEESGLLLSLIFVFLGGLALNLTPCVYPLIPITIGYFGGQAEGKTSRLFLLGVLYVLGMALTYSVIGVVTSLSGAVFGTLLQNPFVIIGIALLFVILALSQFGVYEFKLPDSLVMKAGGAKGGVFGAFFMGLTMGIVAAPCIGPFVLGLVTYVAAKGDPFYGFLMFFVLALGLGLPYLLLALFSGKIKNLPRAGFWMDGVKHIFGFLLLGMAIYFLNPILPKGIQSYTLPIFGIISVIILFFMDKEANKVKGFRIFKIIFSVVVLAVSIYALTPQKKLEPEWQTFSLDKYEASLNNNEKMIIDFYADWCIPCKELDAMTFSDPTVVEKMQDYSCYKVDMTKMDDEKENLRKKFNVVGMPTVLIINAEGKEVHRITGFVNAEEFLKLIE